MKHRATLQVRFYELDPYEHVNHSVYIQYFEAARVQWLAEVGFPLSKLKAEGIQIVVVELHTRYLGSAGPADELTVETELTGLRRASMSFEQRIRRNDEVLVEQTISATCLGPTGRPIRVPKELVEALRGAS
ncbi:MAG: thioesterase family protein [Acidimicrobiia bacterium]|nr:thioesterase family protein [Acidimicrobiia bacterium]